MPSSDDDSIATDGDRLPEVVTRRSVGGAQLVEPLSGRRVEQVGRPRAVPVIVVVGRADDDAIPADRHVDPEVIASRGIAREISGREQLQELLLGRG